MPRCTFYFDKKRFYNSGETITGKIDLELSREFKIHKLCTEFVGKAYVEWVDLMARYVKLYTGEEKFVEYSEVLQEDDNLGPGKFTYNFSFDLPPMCPTTMHRELGGIIYEVVLRIIEKHTVHSASFTSSPEKVFKQEVVVIQLLPLSSLPAMQESVIRDDSVSLGWCCCDQRKIRFALQIPKYAYLPGSTISYSYVFNNQSTNTPIEADVDIILQQVCRFEAQVPRTRARYTCTILDSVSNIEGFDARSTRTVTGEIAVPITQPTTQSEHIVNVKYELCLEANIRFRRYMRGRERSVRVSVPVIVCCESNVLPKT